MRTTVLTLFSILFYSLHTYCQSDTLFVNAPYGNLYAEVYNRVVVADEASLIDTSSLRVIGVEVIVGTKRSLLIRITNKKIKSIPIHYQYKGKEYTENYKILPTKDLPKPYFKICNRSCLECGGCGNYADLSIFAKNPIGQETYKNDSILLYQIQPGKAKLFHKGKCVDSTTYVSFIPYVDKNNSDLFFYNKIYPGDTLVFEKMEVKDRFGNMYHYPNCKIIYSYPASSIIYDR